MRFKVIKYRIFIGMAVFTSFALTTCKSGISDKLPNILWITSEDNSAYFMGCYGNTYATTPNIDRLAEEGFLYLHAYATSPVCAPARNTLLTGVYSASNGNENMRSTYPKSKEVHTYPEYFRDAGYYCTNNYKTDYNTSSVIPSEIWDESSGKAHYRNRSAGQPFFAVFNLTSSHEGHIHKSIPSEELRHDPAIVELPPYHPDLPEIRHDWAQYYDHVEEMDTQVGELLKELEESGEDENTIVIYCSDNGGVLFRSKIFLYETGTQVPLIVRIPEKYKYLYPAATPGEKIGRLVNFVDFAPTLLSIAGIPIPDYMQGNAFLGSQKTKDPEYTFMTTQRDDERYDLARSVRDKKYRYIRNYMPRKHIQHKDYILRAPSARAWVEAYKSGKTNAIQSKYFQEKPREELYDTENDYWEVNDLATDPAYISVLKRMRGEETEWRREIRDVGLIPETEYKVFLGEYDSMYDYMRSPECPLDELIEASNRAMSGKVEDLDLFIGYLGSNHPGIRYWGATGLLLLKESAAPAISALKAAADDESAAVASFIAEALYGLGEKDEAIKAYLRILRDTVRYDIVDRTFVLNSIDAVNARSDEIVNEVKRLKNRYIDIKDSERYNFNDFLMAEYLLKKKWEVEYE